MVGRPRKLHRAHCRGGPEGGRQIPPGDARAGKDAPYVSYGIYREVNPPQKLVFTWAFEKMPGDDSDFVPAETLVTVEFVDKGSATEVVLTHELFPDEHMRDEHQQGWDGCLAGLDRLFASGS